MNIAVYQIVAPLICILLIMKAISHYLRGEKTIRELIAWIVFWGGFIVIALFPVVTEKLAIVLGIKSNVNAVVFTALGILSYLCFKLLILVETGEQQLTKLTRSIAKKEFLANKKSNE